jgi:uncharacterized protein YegJ (DUF2314 family)
MKPRLTWPNVLIFILGALLIVAGFRTNVLPTCILGSALAGSAVGMAYRQSWAPWLAIASLTAFLALTTVRVVQHSLNWTRAAALLGGVSLLVEIIKEVVQARRTRNRPLIALVQLRRVPNNFLTDKKLTDICERVWNVKFGNAEGGSDTHYVVGQNPAFIVSAPDGVVLLVNNFAAPYFDDPNKAAGELNELRIRHALESHTAWLSVDLLAFADDTRERSEAYPAIAKLFVELLDDDCLAVFAPETGSILPYEPELAEKLRGPNPLAAFHEVTYAPVVQVADDDPRMKAAVDEARRRWPEFVSAFSSRAGEHFSIKAPVTVDDNTEFIWIEVDHIENNIVHGKLANDPVALGNLRCGDTVTVELADLNDWNYMLNEELKGGFTVKVLQDISGEDKSAA